MVPENAALETVGPSATGAVGSVAAPAGVIGPGRVAPIVVAVAPRPGGRAEPAPVAAPQLVLQDVAVAKTAPAALIATAEEADLAARAAVRS